MRPAELLDCSSSDREVYKLNWRSAMLTTHGNRELHLHDRAWREWESAEYIGRQDYELYVNWWGVTSSVPPLTQPGWIRWTMGVLPEILMPTRRYKTKGWNTNTLNADTYSQLPTCLYIPRFSTYLSVALHILLRQFVETVVLDISFE